jgi:uncharacterized protein DUF4953
LLLAWAAPAQAHHSWSHYHWVAPVYPIHLGFVDSTSKGLREQNVLPTVLHEWSAAGPLELSSTPGDNGVKIRHNCPIPAGKVRICDANFGPGEFGHTDLNLDGDRILGARILVNNYWGTNRSYRRFVVCHEVGHSLGLDHQSGGSNSCLAGGKHPDEHDFEMLRQIYPRASDPPADEGCIVDPICQPGILIQQAIESIV